MELDSNKEIGLVYTNGISVYVNEKISYRLSNKECGDLSKRILINNCIGTTSTVMVRSSLIKKVNGFDEKLPALQDYDLWIRLCQITKVSVIAIPLINYYNIINSKQISSNVSKYEEGIKYIRKKYSNLYEGLSLEEEKKYRQSVYNLLINKCYRNNHKKKSRVYIKEKLKDQFSIRGIVEYILSFLKYSFILKIRSKL